MPAELTAIQIRDLVGIAPLMLEIGANDGYDTLLFIEAMPSIRIYCFEPDPRAAARFRNNVKDGRAILIEAAVSDKDDFATFNGSSGEAPARSRRQGAHPSVFLKDYDLSGSLLTPTGHLDYSSWVKFPENRQFLVRTTALDNWWGRAFIDFIWADVQGAEALLIAGAQRILKERTRFFYTEFYNTPMYKGQPNLREIQAMLPTFELLDTYGDNALFRNKRL